METVSTIKPNTYREFHETMYLELHPEGMLEQSFAEEIAGATWRLRCCAAAEAELPDYGMDLGIQDEPTDKIRKSIERARAAAHSILHRSLNQLRKLRTERGTPIESPEELPVEAVVKPPSKPTAQVGRNELCPCGSGQKYKKCCARVGAGWPANRQIPHCDSHASVASARAAVGSQPAGLLPMATTPGL